MPQELVCREFFENFSDFHFSSSTFVKMVFFKMNSLCTSIHPCATWARIFNTHFVLCLLSRFVFSCFFSSIIPALRTGALRSIASRRGAPRRARTFNYFLSFYVSLTHSSISLSLHRSPYPNYNAPLYLAVVGAIEIKTQRSIRASRRQRSRRHGKIRLNSSIISLKSVFIFVD